MDYIYKHPAFSNSHCKKSYFYQPQAVSYFAVGSVQKTFAF